MNALLNAAMLRWLDELSSSGVLVTDRDLVIRSWNGWLARTTGKPADAVLDRPLFEVLPDLPSRGFDRYYRGALEGQVVILAHRFHGHLIRVQTPTGEMPQSSSIAPLVTSAGIVGTVTVIEDVSERVHKEQELRRQIVAAQEAREAAENALRLKDEFLATLSHELRTPLNAVLGWTNILLGGQAGPEVRERALKVIERNAQAQARLVDDMLDMARIVTGKLRLDMAVLDLATATMAAIDVVSPSATAKRLAIKTSFDGPALMRGDAARLQQVVWNVLSNAVKFTPPGGSIDVRIAESRGSVRLVVTDTGKGIAPEFLPHVFERFRQANPSQSRTEGGLGLGLALVRQIVEMHGGEVTVSSEGLGRGATFTITFPGLGQHDDSAAARSAVAIVEGSLRGRRVLIVEDDGDWREAIAEYLREAHVEVHSVGTAEDAMDLLTSGTALPDVVLVDIGLPHEDGYELLRRIRASGDPLRSIPAIAVTAYAGLDYQRQALNSGFDLFRTKPIAPEGVALAILELSSRFRSGAPAVTATPPAAPDA